MVEKKKKKAKRKNPNPKSKMVKGNTLSVGHGRPKMTEQEKALSLSNRTQFKILINKYMGWSKEKIAESLSDSKLPIIDIAVLRCLKEAAESGSMERIDWAVNHVLGKEKEKTHLHVSGNVDNTSTIDLKKLSKPELLALKAMAEKNEIK